MKYYNSFFKAKLRISSSQLNSRTLTVDLKPETIEIWLAEIEKKLESVRKSSLFEAPLCGKAATLTANTSSTNDTTTDFLALGLTETDSFKAKKYAISQVGIEPKRFARIQLPIKQ